MQSFIQTYINFNKKCKKDFLINHINNNSDSIILLYSRDITQWIKQLQRNYISKRKIITPNKNVQRKNVNNVSIKLC